jgi:hypothetical protein
LAELSGPLQPLTEFLRLDPDLLAAAAEGSRPLAMKSATCWLPQRSTGRSGNSGSGNARRRYAGAGSRWPPPLGSNV